MKKCPYCAELIQDEAVLCRYCGKDLPSKDDPAIRIITADEFCKLPANYKPLTNNTEAIYQEQLAIFQQGKWRECAMPPRHGYIPRHYLDRVSLEEFLALKEEMLRKCWEESDKTPDGMIDWLWANHSSWKNLAASDAFTALCISLGSFNMSTINSLYTRYLENVLESVLTVIPSETVMFSSSILESIEKAPALREIPEVYRSTLIAEAKRLISMNTPYKVRKAASLPELIDEIDKLAGKIADLLDKRHKKFPSNSPYSFIVEYTEIQKAVDEATKNDSRFSEGTRADLCLQVGKELKKRNYM
jgi:hypothetical protein